MPWGRHPPRPRPANVDTRSRTAISGHIVFGSNNFRSPSLYSSHTVPKRGSPARILTISALSRVLPVGGQISLAEANSEIAMVVRQPWSALAAD